MKQWIQGLSDEVLFNGDIKHFLALASPFSVIDI